VEALEFEVRVVGCVSEEMISKVSVMVIAKVDLLENLEVVKV
jgi:hypothetical protein